MLRLIAFLIGIALIATGLAWLADRPGELVLYWQGYRVETSVFRAAVIFVALVASALFIWSILRNVWHSPATVGNVLNKRRQKLGIDALSSGMIALGAGDKAAAMRSAIQARKSLPNEPLTHLLRAQAAQLSGDRTTARRIFEAMLAAPDTEQLGLRGLFLEAQREGEREAALHFAERAVALNPKLAWAVDALFDIQCRDGDWDGALETLAIARKNGHVDRAQADRRRAVLLTAQAQAAETSDPERSLNLATEAHALAPDLVPAAAIAGRLLASRGNTGRAAKIIQRTWSRAPHPDLATAYAYARIGDSPRDRLERVRQLAALSPNSLESPIAVATAAIEARQFDTARDALEPLIPERMTQRVATLMARIEGEQHADKGRIREWLARAVHAERDPVWTADGFVAERWMPVSPVSGALDAFQWRVPVEAMDKGERELIASKLDELMALGVRPADEQSESAEPPRKDEKPAASSAASSGKWDKSDAVTVKTTGTSGSGTRNGESASQRTGAQGANTTPKGNDFSRARAPDDPGPDADDHDASGPLRPQSA
ncbi:heme biosynthesis protein HemY [Hyphomicrobium sulfonivorans]|uniref:heme biosynthesis protein HemY n=1 Tax=Hyphomicrobium sulfonivorans TaxID=121290 RepID=UPI00156F7895|nr:heme biosynthesis HemY N-terminal domain-containing protein [Hyphomicrobium sulfonivorans]MBI1648370.1 heme biosynthesis protein HemY [Hyphomicrobium sulfonivorans]NSL71094.1 heme biosynthesis protein HemY [Hyphomicrobium sulfonivorans]